MTPRGTLGLCCLHIAQLITHPAIYTLYQVMMDYKHFMPLTLVDIGPRVFQRGCRVAEICVSQKPCKIVRKA